MLLQLIQIVFIKRNRIITKPYGCRAAAAADGRRRILGRVINRDRTSFNGIGYEKYLQTIASALLVSCCQYLKKVKHFKNVIE